MGLPLLSSIPWSSKLYNLPSPSTHPLKAMSRDPQFQVGNNYSYLFISRSNISECWYLKTHFIPNNKGLID